MAALLDIDLKQVAQIVKRGRGVAEPALLLNRGRLGVALDDDEAAQHRAVFARDLLPRGLALMPAKTDPAPLDRRRQEDAPAVFRHLDIAKAGPPLGLDADRGAQIDLARLEPVGAALLPPVERARVPAFERAAQPRVGAEPDIVGDQPVVIDPVGVRHVLAPSKPTPARGRIAAAGRCRSASTPPRRRPRWDAGRSSSATG